MVFAKNFFRYLVVYALILFSLIAALGYFIFSFFELVASKGKNSNNT